MNWAADLKSGATCRHCRHRLAQHAEVEEGLFQCAFCHCLEGEWIKVVADVNTSAGASQ